MKFRYGGETSTGEMSRDGTSMDKRSTVMTKETKGQKVNDDIRSTGLAKETKGRQQHKADRALIRQKVDITNGRPRQKVDRYKSFHEQSKSGLRFTLAALV
jgi:hypothetical protein